MMAKAQKQEKLNQMIKIIINRILLSIYLFFVINCNFLFPNIIYAEGLFDFKFFLNAGQAGLFNSIDKVKSLKIEQSYITANAKFDFNYMNLGFGAGFSKVNLDSSIVTQNFSHFEPIYFFYVSGNLLNFVIDADCTIFTQSNNDIPLILDLKNITIKEGNAYSSSLKIGYEMSLLAFKIQPYIKGRYFVNSNTKTAVDYFIKLKNNFTDVTKILDKLKSDNALLLGSIGTKFNFEFDKVQLKLNIAYSTNLNESFFGVSPTSHIIKEPIVVFDNKTKYMTFGVDFLYKFDLLFLQYSVDLFKFEDETRYNHSFSIGAYF